MMNIWIYGAFLAAAIWLLLFPQLGDAQAIAGCYATMDCSGQQVSDSDIVDAESCCIADTPLSYMPSGGGACMPCQVVGWEMPTLEVMEGAAGVGVRVQAVKGDPSLLPVQLRYSYMESRGSATSGMDYTQIQSNVVIVRRAIASLPVIITTNGDQISQEGDEDFFLVLSPIIGTLPANFFLRDRLRVVIQDTTVARITWTENDYRAGEADEQVVGIIQTSATLARDITLRIIPLTYSQAMLRDDLVIPVNLPTATRSIDFSQSEIVVTIPAGSITANVIMPIVDDLIHEEPEEGFLALLRLEQATFPELVDTTTGNLTLGRISDNDACVVSFELPSYTFPELDSNSNQFVVLELQTLSEVTVTAQVEITTFVSDGTSTEATLNQDYTFSSGLLIDFLEGESAKNVPVSILPDNLVERREGFTLQFSRAPNSPPITNGPNPTTTVFIDDNDGVVVGFSQTTVSGTENQGTIQVCAQIFSGSATVSVPFQILVSSAALTASTSDYTEITNQQLSFDLLTPSPACVDITITDDEIFEEDEQLQLTLSQLSPPASFPPLTIDPPTAVVTILDDDMAMVGFDPTTYTVDEGLSVTIFVRLMSTIAREVTVSFRTVDGTAVSTVGGDYTSQEQTITFEPDSISNIAFVSVQTATDNVPELAETFTAVLSEAEPAGRVTITQDTATVEITDTSDVIVEFDPVEYGPVVEGPLRSVSFRIVARAPPARQITVLFSTRSQTALASQDFSPRVQFPVTFAAGDTEEFVEVVIINDSVYEGEEEFEAFLELQAGSSGVALGQQTVASATIQDDDEVIVGFNPTSYSDEEGQAISFIVDILEGQAQANVLVNFATRDVTASAPGDYASTSQVLTFSPGTRRLTVSVQTSNDALFEGDETFEAVLTLPSVGSERITLRDERAAAIVEDNDAARVGFIQNMYTVDEGQAVTILVQLFDSIANSVTVRFRTIDGTADSSFGGDYTAEQRTITFEPDGNTIAFVTVQTLSDERAELAETFMAQLSEPSAGLTITVDTATIEITDTTDVVVEFDPVTYEVTESGSVAFMVVLRTQSQRQITVFFATNEGSATSPEDYIARTGVQVTFAPGQQQQTVQVNTVSDARYEREESFTAVLSLASNSEGVILGSQDTATATILDDDQITIGFEQTTYDFSEPSFGTSTQMICIQLRSGTLSSNLFIQPEWTQNTAIAGVDYVEPAGAFMLEAGQTRSCITLTLNSDILFEATEQLSGRLIGTVEQQGGAVMRNPPRVTFNPEQTVISIRDDPTERLTIGFEQETYTVNEPTGVQTIQSVCMVILQGTLGRNLTVRPITNDGTATTGIPSLGGDYIPPAQSDFVFRPAIALRPCIDIIVFNDDVFEGPEEFTITVQGFILDGSTTITPSLSGVTVNPARATITIRDNDMLVIGFVNEVYAFSEPNPGTVSQTEQICIEIKTGRIASPLTIVPRWTAGTATESSDYSPPVGRYNLDEDTSMDCLDLTVINDNILESTEDLTGQLESFVVNGLPVQSIDGVELNPAQTLVQIQDNDAVVIGFEMITYSINEPEIVGFTDLEVCMRLTVGALGMDLTLLVEWVPGRATEGNFPVGDYSPELSAEQFLFRSGASRVCGTIVIYRDNAFEFDEDFAGEVTGLRLAGGTIVNAIPGVTITPTRTEVLIIDNNELTLGFERELYEFREPIASSSEVREMVCVSVRAGNVGTALIITPMWIPNTATLDVDYRDPTSEFLLNSGETRNCVEITILNDNQFEFDEDITGRLLRVMDINRNQVPADRLTIDVDETLITIEDNDEVRVGFERESYTTSEPSGAVQITVDVCMIVFNGAIGRQLSIAVQWQPDTAQIGVPGQGGDYVPPVENTFVFEVGATRVCRQAIVFDDNLFEMSEQFSVQYTGIVLPDGTSSLSVPGVMVQPSAATVLILDNDGATIGFERLSYSFAEPGTGTSLFRENICVTVSQGILGFPLVIVPQWTAVTATAGVGGDYSPPSGRYRLENGETSDCLEVTIFNDIILEDVEEFTGQLVGFEVDGSIVAVIPGIIVQPQRTTVEITDNDAVTIGFERSRYTISEPTSGTATLEVCMTLTVGSLGRTVVIEPQWIPDSAQASSDFSPPPTNFEFQVGDTRSCVDIIIRSDNLFESSEEFRGRATTTAPGVTIDPPQTTIEITDVNELTVGFEMEQYTFTEPDSGVSVRIATVCIVVADGSSQLGVTLTVQPLWRDGSATVSLDYTPPTDTYIIEAGDDRDCLQLMILDDSIFEGSEELTGSLEGIVNQLGQLVRNPDRIMFDSATTTIQINDNDGVTIGFEEEMYGVGESDGMAFVVALVRMGELSTSIVINFRTEPLTAETPTDYQTVERALTFSSGMRRIPVSIPIQSDQIDEPNETFRAVLSQEPATSTVTLRPAAATVTITDDDGVTIGLELPGYTVNEGDSNVEVCAVLLEGSLQRTLMVNLSTQQNANAQEVEDYSHVITLVVFDRDTTRACTNVPIVDDAVVEVTEMFGVVLTTREPDVNFLNPSASVDIIDNDRVVIGFEMEQYQGEEGGTVEVCAVLTNGTLERSLFVELFTSDVSAEAPLDYPAVTNELTFNSDRSRECVSIRLVNDSLLEPTEEFELSLTSDEEQVILNPERAVVSILDTDAARIGFERERYSGREPNEVINVTVAVLAGTLSQEVVVRIYSMDSTAKSPDDYEAINRTLTFDSERSRLVIPVRIVNDGVDEEDEQLLSKLQLESVEGDSPNVQVAPSEATLTILDDDGISIGFELPRYTVNEGDGIIEVCAVLTSGSLERTVTFTLSTGDNSATSTDPVDFSAVAVELQFNETTSRACADIPITDDNRVEFPENFTVVIRSDDPDVDFAPPTAVVTILDNDRVVIGFEMEQYQGEEGGMVEVCAVLMNGTLERSFFVELFTSDVSAEAPLDYTAVTTELTFNSERSRECVSIRLVNDSLLEPTEEFEVSLTSDEEQVILNLERAVVSILDTDAARIGFERERYSGREPNEVINVTVAVLAGTLSQEVVVRIYSMDSTARSPDDYEAINRTLTFDSERSRLVIPVRIINDGVDEEDEQLLSRLQLEPVEGESPNVQVAPSEATLTILDDDGISIGFELPRYTVNEGDGSIEVCAVLTSGSLERTVTFTLSTGDDSATSTDPVDFSAVAIELQFNETTSRACADIPITDDNRVELPENFTLDIRSDDPDVDFAPPTSVVTILDNDRVVIGFEMEQYQGEEGGTVEVCTVLMNGTLERSSFVELFTSDVSAEAPLDYTAVTNELTFNSERSRECVSIRLVNDSLLEPTENFEISLTSDEEQVILNPERAVVSILDTDAARIGFERERYSGREPSEVINVTVAVLAGTLSQEVVVRIYSMDSTAKSPDDYEAINRTLTFDSERSRLVIPVRIINDGVDEEDEQLLSRFQLEPVEGDSPNVQVAPSEATLTILDDDGISIGFELPRYTVNEGDGSIEVCAVLTSGSLERTVTFSLSTGDDSATSTDPVDFSAVAVELQFNETTSRACADIPITDDNRVELPENFTLVIRSDDPDVEFVPPTSVVTILDNDRVVIGFEMEQYQGEEGGTVEVCAVLMNGTLERSLFVELFTSDVSAEAPLDYTAVTTELTFNSERSRECVSIRLVNDSLLEPTENFEISLTSDEEQVILNPERAVVSILDTDAARIGFERERYSGREPNEVIDVTVAVLAGTLSQEVVVRIYSMDSTARSPDDYEAINRTLTFDSERSRLVIPVRIINDGVDEEDEQLLSRLQLEPVEGDSPNVQVSPNEALLVIVDDDGISVGFELPRYTVNEGDGSIEVCAVLTSGSLERTVTFTLSTGDDSATSTDPVDFSAVAVELQFNETTSRACADIPITDDNRVELPENFTVDIRSDDPDVNFVPPNATVSILDNDRVVIGFEMEQYQGEEGGMVEVCAVLMNDTLERSLFVELFTSDISAEAPSDYTDITTELTFNSDRSRECVSIRLVNDSLLEPTEEFELSLTSDEEQVILNPERAVVSILDTDAARIGFERERYSGREPNEVINVTVAVLAGALSQKVVVRIYSMDSTARFPDDYEAINRTLTFDSERSRLVIPVRIINDGVDEEDEQLLSRLQLEPVEGDSPNVQVAPSEATLTILDDDGISIGFELPRYTVNEGDGSIEVCAVLTSGSLERTVTFTLSTGDDSAISTDPVDFSAVAVELQFNETTSRACADIPITDDNRVELPENFTVEIRSDDPDVEFVPPTSVVTILDNDRVMIGFEMEQYQGEEGRMVEVCAVIRNGSLERDVLTQIFTEDLLAKEPDDYQAVDSELVFGFDSERQCVSISLENDGVLEDIEELQVSLASEETAVILDPEKAIVSILDIDAARIGFERETYSGRESDEVINVTVAVLAGTLSQEIVVRIYSMDSTAISPDDYEAINRTLTFDSERSRLVIPVRIINDGVDEEDEQLLSRLQLEPVEGDSSNVQVAPSEATLTILDDDGISIGFELPRYSVDEGDGSIEVCAVLTSGSLERTVTFILSTGDNSATSTDPVDFSAVTVELQFNETTSRACAGIPITDDNRVELPENFTVVIRSDDPDVDFVPPTSVVTILDNDRVVIGFEMEQYQGEEGGIVEVCAVLMNGTLELSLFVELFTSDVSTEAPLDYTDITTELTFNSERSRECVSIRLVNDSLLEPTEEFEVSLTSDEEQVILNPERTVVSILDTDAARIGFERERYSGREPNEMINVTVAVLAGTLSQEVVVRIYSMDSTARSPDDYETINRTLTFDSERSRLVIPVRIINDGVDEEDEQLLSRLQLEPVEGDSPNVQVSPNEALLVIVDDDGISVGFELPRYTVNEGDGSIEVCAVLTSGSLERTVTFTLSTGDDSAISTDPVDFSAVAIELQFNETTSRACADIPITDDNRVELPENFTVDIRSDDPDVNFAPPNATVSILDNDRVVIGFEMEQYQGEEGGMVEVCAVLMNDTLERSLFVELFTSDVSAEAPLDYTAVTTELAFNSDRSRECVSIRLVNDSLLEPTEEFELSLTSDEEQVILNPERAVVSILDTDAARIGFERERYSGREPNEVINVTVAVLAGALSQEVVVRIYSMDSTARSPDDYEAINRTLTFDSERSRLVIPVRIINDGVDEEDEQLLSRLQLEPVEGDSPNIQVAPNEATLTILDDDGISISFELPRYTVNEGDGSIEVCAVLTSGSLERTVTFTLSTGDDSATSTDPVDFSAVAVELQFNETTSRACADIPITDDNRVELPENFTVDIRSDDPDMNFAPPNATVSILDNDRVMIGFEMEQYQGEEGGMVEVCAVIRNGSLERDVLVQIFTEDLSAKKPGDYQAVDSELVFGFDSERQCASVSLENDGVLEDIEELQVSLASEETVVILDPEKAIVSILDIDAARIGFERETYSGRESDEVINVTVAVLAGTLSQEVVVRIYSMDSTARFPDDYEAINRTLTFDSERSRLVIPVRIINDGVDEEDEQLLSRLQLESVKGDSPNVQVAPSKATLTILDDDGISIGFELPRYTVNEGDGIIEVCAVLTSGSLERTVTFTLSTGDNSATSTDPVDFSAVAIELQFNVTTSRACADIPITDDKRVELPENFTVVIRSDDPDVDFAPPTSVVTILDNDRVVIGFVMEQYQGEEGGIVEVCAVLMNGTLERSFFVELFTSDVSAEAPLDYTAVTTELTFNSERSRECVPIRLVNDSLLESTEEFEISLASDEEQVILNPERAVVSILDTDAARIGFERERYSGREPNEVINVTVAVLAGTLSQEVVVRIYSMDSTARSPDDYEAINRTLTFDSERSRLVIPVRIINDGVDEEDEQLLSRLQLEPVEGDSPNVQVSPNEALLVIVDDDGILVGFELPRYSVNEGDGSIEVCAVLTSGSLERTVTFTLSTGDDSATSTDPVDFSAVAVELQFNETTSRACADIPITDDNRVELPENFTIEIRSDDPDVEFVPPTSVVTIFDNDRVVIGFEMEQYQGEEGRLVEVCAIVRNGSLERDVLTQIFTEDLSAKEPDDYQAVDSELVFGFDSERQCVSISLGNDGVLEDIEELQVSLASEETAVILDPEKAIISILDIDAARIGFERETYSGRESDEVINVTVAVLAGTLSQEIVVRIYSMDSTARSPDDYEAINRTLTFDSERSRLVIPVRIINDGVDEEDEQLLSKLQLEPVEGDSPNVQVAPSEATLTILDDDGISINFELPRYTVNEGDGSIEVCAVLTSGSLERTVTFTLSTGDDSATSTDPVDFSAVTVELQFNETTSRACADIPITDDNRVELPENFTVDIRSDDPEVNFAPPTATVTILDNDRVVIGFEMEQYQGEEGRMLEVCAILMNGTLEQSLFVELFTSDVSAEAPLDYTAVTTELTFNSDRSRECVSIRLVNDSLLEPTEEFEISLMSDEEQAILNLERAVVSILDTDAARIGFERETYSGREPNEVINVTVAVLTGTLSQEVVFRIYSMDSTARSPDDYEAINRTLTFDSERSRLVIPVRIINDGVDEEDEQLLSRLQLEPVEGDSPNVQVSPNEAILVIVDDDGISVGFELPRYIVNEGDGSIEVCAVLTSGSLERTVTFTLSTGDDSATSTDPVDFSAVAVELQFNETTSRACADIPITDDNRVELPENFTVDIRSDDPDVEFVPPTSVVTIFDNDRIVIGFETEQYQGEEGGMIEVCAIIRSGALERSALVELFTQNVSAEEPDDFTTVSLALKFDSESNRMCVLIPLLRDDLLEETETFEAVLSNGDLYITLTPEVATITILDTNEVTIGFERRVYSVEESSMIVQVGVVIIEGTLSHEVEVTIRSMDGTARSAVDFTPIDQTLIFSKEVTEINVTVMIVEDSVNEMREQFTANLQLTTSEASVIINPNVTTIFIEDDDRVVIGLERENYQVSEGAGTVEVCAIVRQGSLDREVVLELSTSDLTAQSGVDYDPRATQLTFSASNSRECAEIPITEDSVSEPLEMFVVSLSFLDSPEGITILPATANVTIIDNDDVSVMFARPSYTFSEDDVIGIIEVVLSGPVRQDAVVIVSGGPSLQEDVTTSGPSVNMTLVFSGPGLSIAVALNLTDDDDALEAIEMYQLTLTIPPTTRGVVSGEPIATTINILDDDILTVELGQTLISVNESDAEYVVCVNKSHSSVRPVTVEVVDVPGTAQRRIDYVELTPPQAVILPAGPAGQTCFTGDIIDDQLALEPVEQFTLRLRDPVIQNVLVGNDETIVRIIDDDMVVTTLTQDGFRRLEGVGRVTVCVIKDLETASQVNVTLRTINGTAQRLLDFSGDEYLTVTLPREAGAVGCVSIPIIDDTIFESVEDFRVELSIDGDLPGVQLGDITIATVLIDDLGPEVPSVNDTIVGDPLLTIPLSLDAMPEDLNLGSNPNTKPPALCYEFHGERDQYFNLISDNCVSVNAHYIAINDYFNVMDEVGIRTVDRRGVCHNIAVNVDSCSAIVDGQKLMGNYRSAGIFIRNQYTNHVRVSVPNCNSSSHLVMYIICQRDLSVEDPWGGPNFKASMLKFVVARGINLNENSHGLLGQFWNVPIEVANFDGQVDSSDELDLENRYSITVRHPDAERERTFTAILYDFNWEFTRQPCFYAGNQQGGPIAEVLDPNDSVIEGEYFDYLINELFATSYKFSRFEENVCTAN